MSDELLNQGRPTAQGPRLLHGCVRSHVGACVLHRDRVSGCSLARVSYRLFPSVPFPQPGHLTLSLGTAFWVSARAVAERSVAEQLRHNASHARAALSLSALPQTEFSRATLQGPSCWAPPSASLSRALPNQKEKKKKSLDTFTGRGSVPRCRNGT